MSTVGAHREAGADAASSLRFVTRGLDEAQIAAVTAVVGAALAEQARAAAAQAAASHAEPSEWSRSQRGLRAPLPGRWRGFTA